MYCYCVQVPAWAGQLAERVGIARWLRLPGVASASELEMGDVASQQQVTPSNPSFFLSF